MDKKMIRVEDVMEFDYIMVDGIATVAEALQRMVEADAHFAIVEKRGSDDEFGVVLASDIAKQVLAPNRAPARVNVYEIMAKPVLSVSPSLNIRYCARLFEQFGVSMAPVIADDEIKGIVTYTELVLKGLIKLVDDG